METSTETSTHLKPFAAGHGIEFKELPEKILITGQSRTHLKDGNFILDAEVIHIQAGPGIKISSKGRDTLVISCNLDKMEEEIFDFKKSVDERLKNIEKAFSTILKQVRK